MKKLTLNQKRRRGFTLLEILIVLGIIVAIAAMAAPTLLEDQQSANISAVQGQIKTIEDAMKRKATKKNGIFEEGDGSEMISALAQPWEDANGREQKPLMESVPKDIWGNEFQYSYTSSDLKPKIWSFGPNQQDDGGDPDTDDISNVVANNN